MSCPINCISLRRKTHTVPSSDYYGCDCYFMCLHGYLRLYVLCWYDDNGIMPFAHLLSPLVMINKSSIALVIGMLINSAPSFTLCASNIQFWWFVPFCIQCTYFASHSCYLPLDFVYWSLVEDTAGKIANNEWNHNVSKLRCSFVTSAFLFYWQKLWTLVLFLWQFCLMCRFWWQLNANDDEWLSDCISSLHYLTVMCS